MPVGASLGIEGDELLALRRAALLHDLGRVAVPNGVWEKPSALTQSDWERVRLHPYHSERILARSSPGSLPWPGCTTSGRTPPGTTGRLGGPRYPRRPASWRPPTPYTR